MLNNQIKITENDEKNSPTIFPKANNKTAAKTTERPEGIETGHLHLCDSPKDLSELFGKLIENPYISENCPYGNGHTSEAVLEILRNEKL